jgi:hypothetical protein
MRRPFVSVVRLEGLDAQVIKKVASGSVCTLGAGIGTAGEHRCRGV